MEDSCECTPSHSIHIHYLTENFKQLISQQNDQHYDYKFV
jgi:hypothetical protein